MQRAIISTTSTRREDEMHSMHRNVLLSTTMAFLKPSKSSQLEIKQSERRQFRTKEWAALYVAVFFAPVPFFPALLFPGGFESFPVFGATTNPTHTGLACILWTCNVRWSRTWPIWLTPERRLQAIRIHAVLCRLLSFFLSWSVGLGEAIAVRLLCRLMGNVEDFSIGDHFLQLLFVPVVVALCLLLHFPVYDYIKSESVWRNLLRVHLQRDAGFF